MEKINYNKQEQDSVDRSSRFVDSGSDSRSQSSHTGSVTEPATREQLGLLRGLGIRPKWRATRYEAQEMIDYHQLILNSVNHRRW